MMALREAERFLDYVAPDYGPKGDFLFDQTAGQR